MQVHRTLLLLILTCLTPGLSGCAGGYVLRGRVVEGMPGGIHAVPAAELEEDAPAVAGAQIDIHRDPSRLNREVVASGRSSADGTFAIRVDAFGAGWMDEEWLIETTHGRYRNTRSTLRLPADPGRTQLLIILTPGRGTPAIHGEDLMEEYRRHR